MSFSQGQMGDLIMPSPPVTSSQLLELPISQANLNVAATFVEYNSGGNMQSQEAQTSISTTGSQKMDAQTQFQHQLQCNAAVMNEYFNKLTLPILRMQMTQVKQLKEKIDVKKVEHPQSNILNIPSVPGFRNSQLSNSSSFTNVDQMLVPINPLDLNVHLENEQENESNPQPIIKVEQQVQTDSPKIEKKRFRAKMGEIKISIGQDGSTFFCCSECNLGYTNKEDIDKHILAHLQERKYQCKECGAMLKRKEHLDQHMRGHSDERPYKCTMCEKAFKRNEHLTRHFVIHSGDKNFSCPVCHKAFSRKDHLNKHTQTHTGMRKNKMKSNTYYIDQKDPFDKSAAEVSTMPKQEMKYVLKDNMLKQESLFSQIPESVLLHNLQNLTKDTNILQIQHTLSSLKEQMTRESGMLQQEDVNAEEILPENIRYMPS